MRFIQNAGHLAAGRLTSQSPSPHLSGGRAFYKEEEENEFEYETVEQRTKNKEIKGRRSLHTD